MGSAVGIDGHHHHRVAQLVFLGLGEQGVVVLVSHIEVAVGGLVGAIAGVEQEVALAAQVLAVRQTSQLE